MNDPLDPLTPPTALQAARILRDALLLDATIMIAVIATIEELVARTGHWTDTEVETYARYLKAMNRLCERYHVSDVPVEATAHQQRRRTGVES